MKCPYACNIEEASEDRYEFEEGQNNFHSQKTVTKRTYVDCLEDGCAVWKDGKCTYRGIE